MLAQSFLSAADLRITEPQREALMKTLVLLETGNLRHTGLDDIERSEMFIPRNERLFSAEFNMADWSLTHNCGTVCCIGGTAELIGGVEFDDEQGGLHELFYPKGIGCIRYADITPSQAATALRSYLTTGDAKWSEAV